MSSFWRLLNYIKNYKLLTSLSIVSNVLMAVFTILSIPLLKPIFEFLFEQTELITVRPDFQFTLEGILLWAQYQLSQITFLFLLN